jgi:saccharopine dehydrogenase-like NADP-dependent oxidoreductase
MEAFLSDGLRTLVETLPQVPRMEEKTLRWPGHVAAVRPLVERGAFLDEFRARCVEDRPQDLVALVVRVRRGDRTSVMTMTDRADPATGLTAMARTTALTTSVTAQLVARGGVKGAGVLPLERVGADPAAYEFIVRAMADRGVHLRWSDA